MSFPEDYVSTEPAPLGMFRVERTEMPSVVARHFESYRHRPIWETKHLEDA
ncbi:hypothetical protein ACYOEI_00285 [Singulisphaera rosea]